MRRYGLVLIVAGIACIMSPMIIGTAVAEELHIFAGAGLRQPVDHLVQEFQQQRGHKVVTDFGGSGQLLAKIEVASRGDLFIPGALFYIEKLAKKGKIKTYQRIVYHTPVIGVNRNLSQKITSFDDLAKPGIRLAMGDPKAMAFGRTALTICEKSGQKDAILQNVTVYGATVKQLALYVAQGVVDAAIIGRSDAVQNREKITMVNIPQDLFTPEIIGAAVLQSAPHPELASELCAFFSSPHAIAVFQQYGFLPID